MKKILIIGGAGFLGLHLAKKLIESEKVEVDLLDNFSRGKKDKFLKKILLNKSVKLINKDLTKKILAYDKSYDYIFQFAAIIGVQNVLKNPMKVLNDNFIIQRNAIEIAENQTKLKRFIFSSTSEVHLGNQIFKKLKYPTSENHNIMLYDLNSSRTSYSLSKVYGESMCHFSNLKYTIIRPHNIYGERMGTSHVIPELVRKIKKMKKNQNLFLQSFNHKRCFCYIDDAVNQILLLSKNNKSLNRTFNIGNNLEETKIIDLVKLITKIMNRNDVKIIKKNVNVDSPSRRKPDLNYLYNIIKYKNKFNLSEGCSKVIKWYLEN